MPHVRPHRGGRAGWGGPLAGLNVLEGGGLFTALTRSLPVTKYKPGLVTLWGWGGGTARLQCLKILLSCLPELEAKPEVQRFLALFWIPQLPVLRYLGNTPWWALPSVCPAQLLRLTLLCLLSGTTWELALRWSLPVYPAFPQLPAEPRGEMGDP